MAIPPKLTGREQQDILKRKFNLTSKDVAKLRSSAPGFWGKKLGKTMPTSRFSKTLVDIAETSEGTFIGSKLKNVERGVKSYLKEEAKREREEAAEEAEEKIQERSRAYRRGIEIRKEIRKREEEQAQREANLQRFFSLKKSNNKPTTASQADNKSTAKEKGEESERPSPPLEMPLD